jgi:hypothetical protein
MTISSPIAKKYSTQYHMTKDQMTHRRIPYANLEDKASDESRKYLDYNSAESGLEVVDILQKRVNIDEQIASSHTAVINAIVSYINTLVPTRSRFERRKAMTENEGISAKSSHSSVSSSNLFRMVVQSAKTLVQQTSIIDISTIRAVIGSCDTSYLGGNALHHIDRILHDEMTLPGNNISCLERAFVYNSIDNRDLALFRKMVVKALRLANGTKQTVATKNSAEQRSFIYETLYQRLIKELLIATKAI